MNRKDVEEQLNSLVRRKRLTAWSCTGNRYELNLGPEYEGGREKLIYFGDFRGVEEWLIQQTKDDPKLPEVKISTSKGKSAPQPKKSKKGSTSRATAPGVEPSEPHSP